MVHPPGLPVVCSLATNALVPDAGERWLALVAEQRRWLESQIPQPLQPVGEVRWEVASDCEEPTPAGMTHYRFILQHTRSV